jgi:hypothetical protein
MTGEVLLERGGRDRRGAAARPKLVGLSRKAALAIEPMPHAINRGYQSW